MSDSDLYKKLKNTGPETDDPNGKAGPRIKEDLDDPLADLIAEMPLGHQEEIPEASSKGPSDPDKTAPGAHGPDEHTGPGPSSGADPRPDKDPSTSNLLKALTKAGVVPVGLVPLSPEVIPQARLIKEVRAIPAPAEEPQAAPAKEWPPSRPEQDRRELAAPQTPAPAAASAPTTPKTEAAKAGAGLKPPPPPPAPVVQQPSCPLISTGEEGPRLFMTDPNCHFGIREGLWGAKSKLAAQKKEHGHQAFLFTGPDPGVGVSTVTFNLALVMAQDMADNKILIIDANLSRPSLHRAFGCSPEPGLLNFLTEPLELGMVLVDSGMPNLHLITCGDTAKEVFSPFDLARMDHLLEVARYYYDYILIDTAPALRASNTRILARKVDGVVVTVRYNNTKNQVAQELIRQLTSDGAEIVGSVLNRRLFVIPKFFYKFI